MIRRLQIDNLVVIEHAALDLDAGLTAITGETGTGKTLLATAIALLFGSDADARVVGPHGEESWVEAEFDAPDAFWEHSDNATLAELRPDDEPLVLARRVRADGRTRATAWGRTISRADLRAAGQHLLAVAGQHQQQRLLSATARRHMLDAIGGPDHTALLDDMAQAWATVRAAEAALEQCERDIAQISATRQQYEDELGQIEAVDPSVEDERALRNRREVVRRSAELVEALHTAHSLLAADGGAVDAVGQAWSALEQAAAIDEHITHVAATVLDAQQQLGDASSSIRASLDELSSADTSIDDVEARLSAYDELTRRYGGTVEAVVAYREELQRKLAIAADSTAALTAAQAAVDAAQATAQSCAEKLTAARTAAATTLAARVEEIIHSLGMATSIFEIRIEPAAMAAHGSDAVQFLLAPATGIEPQPLGTAGSGGELSRISLALHVASGIADVPTIVFDEVDAGLGGHTSYALAELLAKLGEHTQVLCITHLAQVAGRAAHNIVVSRDGARTALTMLESDDAVLDELCRMMGADANDEALRAHAQSLRTSRFTRTGMHDQAASNSTVALFD